MTTTAVSVDYMSLHCEAVEAGIKAARLASPARFAVVERRNPFDDTSPVKRVYSNEGKGFEAEGGAGVLVHGNSGFGRWLRKQGQVPVIQQDWYAGQEWPRMSPVRRDSYLGGIRFGVMVRGYERSGAFAAAYVAVINAALPPAPNGRPVARYTSYID